MESSTRARPRPAPSPWVNIVALWPRRTSNRLPRLTGKYPAKPGDGAPPAPAAPPPHKWGGLDRVVFPALRGSTRRSRGMGPLRRLRRHLPTSGEDIFVSLAIVNGKIWARPDARAVLV